MGGEREFSAQHRICVRRAHHSLGSVESCSGLGSDSIKSSAKQEPGDNHVSLHAYTSIRSESLDGITFTWAASHSPGENIRVSGGVESCSGLGSNSIQPRSAGQEVQQLS